MYADRSGNGLNLNIFAPPIPGEPQGGIFRGKNVKNPGNLMKCRESKYIYCNTHPAGGGMGRKVVREEGHEMGELLGSPSEAG